MCAHVPAPAIRLWLCLSLCLYPWQEVRELPKIRHHNVVPCIAHYVTLTHCIIVYQFPEGHTLREALADTAPWQWAPRLRVISDISLGLLHLHSLLPPVAHCGVWASNIFIVGDKAKLGWYGVPMEASANAMEPGYRDPEASNTLQTTLSTDVYCLVSLDLGASLSSCLTFFLNPY